MPREDTCNHHFSGVDEDAGMKGMGSQKLRKVSLLIGWSKVSAQQPGGACFASFKKNLCKMILVIFVGLTILPRPRPRPFITHDSPAPLNQTCRVFHDRQTTAQF